LTSTHRLRAFFYRSGLLARNWVSGVERPKDIIQGTEENATDASEASGRPLRSAERIVDKHIVVIQRSFAVPHRGLGDASRCRLYS
jgi:hypothetical protein